MRKNIIIFLATVTGGLVILFVLSRLGLFPFFKEKPPEKVELTYWGLWEQEEIIQPLIQSYQQNHPNVTINYEKREPQDHFQTVQTRLDSESAPDIVRVHLTWVPFLMSKLAAAPKEIISTNDFNSTFYPVNQKFLVKNGQIFGLPLETDGLALVYNKDLLSKDNIQAPAQTWEKFRDDVRILTKKDDQNRITQAGAALGFADNIDFFSDILGLMFAQNGVAFEDSQGKVKIHQSVSPDNRNLGAEALTFYTLFATSEKSWDPTWENSSLAFARSKVAMIFIPSYKIQDILNISPNLNLGIAPVPQLPGTPQESANAVNWGSFWVEVVAKKSAHPKEAWEFLKYLSEKETQANFYKSILNFRAFGEPFSRQDLASTLSSDRFTYPFVKEAQGFTSWYMADQTHDVSLNDAIKLVLAQMISQVDSGAAAEGALNEAAEKIQDILNSLKD